MLKDIVVQTEKIDLPNDQSFEVQGLTLTHLGKLIAEYKEPLEALMESRLELDNIADKYPEFMAKVVALSANEPDEWEKIASLPFTTQLTAFEKCWDLTIPDYDALKKLIGRIQGLIPKLAEKMESQ
jgi:DNA-binding transcriptional regulator PaaX